uniref:Neuroligin-4, Y-linked n=3 Tax=Cacopsylla melanoneura TaxID=428564 RepID=A0A8D8QBR1_9HEMI
MLLHSHRALTFSLLLILLLVQVSNSKEYTRIIQLKQGRLRGVVRSPVHNGNLNNIHMYLGIPYAAPPVGPLRFMAPQSPQPWPGLMTADTFSPVCPQKLPNLDDEDLGKKMSSGRIQTLRSLVGHLKNQSEDCLYLNIYTPMPDSARSYRRHSVLVIIHGESYSFGSGNIYDGFVLASYANMIVVTFNFRLGILGFLRPGVGTSTVTNFGIMDQVAALQWIKDNIEYFGGDSSSVTLMGHGTGAASINFLMLSPLLSPSYDLFKRAILMSGSALSLWSLVTHPIQYTLQVAQHLNCPETDPEMSACLRNKRLSDITAVDIEGPKFKTAFGPIIDGNVIPNDPEQCMTVYRDIFSRYELMFGLTQMESYHLLDGISLLYGMKYEQTESLLRDFVYSKYEAHPDVALAKILREYNNWNKSSAGLGSTKSDAEENRDHVLAILNDALYDAPLIQTGEYHAKANKETYMYVFGHKTENGMFRYTDQSVSGEEIPYFLGIPLDGDTHHYRNKYSTREKLHSEVIVTWISNFAKTGNPNLGMKERFLFLSPQDWAPYLQLDWPAFDPNNQTYLQLDIPPKMSKHYKKDKIRYWNVNLPQTLSQPVLPSNRPSGGSKYPPGYPPILIPSSPEIDNDYPEHKYMPHPNQENPDPPKPRDFDPRPWIDPPRPKPEDDRDGFNPYDNFPSRTEIEKLPSEPDVVKSSSLSTILIALGVVFLLLNLFAFMFIFYQKNRLNMREHLFNNARMRHFQCASRNPCDGDEDEYEFTDEEVESQIYMKKTAATTAPKDVKSILKNNNSDYEAVSTNKQVFVERKNSSSTVDGNMKVRQWIVEKCNGDTPFEMDASSDEMTGKTMKAGTAGNGGNQKGDGKLKENIYVDRKEHPVVKKESDYDVIKSRRKISNDSSSTKKQSVKKVSVAVDATPAARTASVLRQIPIEIAKSSKSLNEISKEESEIPLVLRKNKSFDYPDEEYSEDKSRTLPSTFNKKRSMSTTSIHELKQLIDSSKTFQDMTLLKEKTKTLKNKSPKTVHKNEANILDVNVTCRDECQANLPLTHQQMMNGIKRRNFPKVLPEYPQNNESIPLPSLPLDVRRLSLPPNSFDLCSNESHGGGIGIPKIPPLPPPRISSTLGRKPQQPLHKSQVFIQLNKNENTIPETVDENNIENEKSIEEAIDKILKCQPKLTKQNSVDLESTINKVQCNLEAIEHSTGIRNDRISKPNPAPAKVEPSPPADGTRNSNSFESAIKKQKNKILHKLTGSNSSSSNDSTSRNKNAKTEKESVGQKESKDTSPECINLSQENVFYETVFHDTSVTNLVPNSETNESNKEIPFVHTQKNKTPEEIYKSLKMIRLEKEKLESSLSNASPNNKINTSVPPSTSSMANPSLPINDKTSTYAIIRNTNQNPQQLLNSQQKVTKVSKEPKYIIKPQLSQITSSAQHANKRVPHTVVPNTTPSVTGMIPEGTSPRVAPNKLTGTQGVHSNVMIGTKPNIITGVQSTLGQSIPNKEGVDVNYKVPYTTTAEHVVESLPSDNSKSSGSKSSLANTTGVNYTSNLKSEGNSTSSLKNNSTSPINSNSQVPNKANASSSVIQDTPRVIPKNNDVTRTTNSDSHKIAAKSNSTSTETLSSDKSCSSTQSSKNNYGTASSGMSTIKKKKKS